MPEMLKIVDEYMDGSYEEAGVKFKEYIMGHSIQKAEVDEYIRLFLLSIFKNYYELGLDHVLT